MMFRRSLKARMILAFSCFSILLATFYWGLLMGFLMISEDVIFNRQLNLEVQRQLRFYARHQQFDNRLPPDMVLHSEHSLQQQPWYNDLVEEFESLSPANTLFNAQPYFELEAYDLHIARLSTTPAQTYLVYWVDNQDIDEESFDRIDRIVFIIFIIVAVTGVLTGTLIGSRTAAPVVRLHKRIQRLNDNEPFGETDSFGQDELGRLAHAFAAAWDRSQQFLIREKRFTREVSHELRTPSAIIRGALDVLALQPDNPQAMARIRRANLQLEQLIDTFLLLGREENLQLSAEVLDIEPLCRALIEQHQPGSPVPIHFIQHQTPTLHILPPLFAVLLGNLLRNALQHTQRGEVNVTLEAEQLTVSDTGCGFPADMQAQVGQPYVDDSHGQGLGLSIVIRICQQFGWQLHIDSQPGLGSHVRVLFQPPPHPHE